MLILGVDTESLPDQFEGCVAGRTLVLDGDGPCYVAAATVKRLDTGIRRFQQDVMKRMFLVGAEHCRVHLTARNSDKHGRFRVKAAKPYQGQRDSSAKPALLEPLREAMSNRENWLENFTVSMHRELEADDGMMQDAYSLKEDGVISSEDKDLRMTPYPYFDLGTGQVRASQPVGYVEKAFTGSGTVKMAGQGPMFFWGQMLCGDTADNVRGIEKYEGKLCGPALACEILQGVRTIEDAANLVIEGYYKINQNVLAEGWLLWLTRWHKDNVVQYIREISLMPKLVDFVEDCLRRDWVTTKEVQDAATEV